MIARRIWAEKRSYQWIWIDVNQQAIEAFELTLIAAAVFVSGLNHTHSSSNAHSYCGCFVVSRSDFWLPLFLSLFLSIALVTSSVGTIHDSICNDEQIISLFDIAK